MTTPKKIAPFAIMTSGHDPQIYMQTDAKAGETIALKCADDGIFEHYGIFKTGEDLKQGQRLWKHGAYLKTYPPIFMSHHSKSTIGNEFCSTINAKKISDDLVEAHKKLQETLTLGHLLGAGSLSFQSHVLSAKIKVAYAEKELEKTLPHIELPTHFMSPKHAFVSAIKHGKSSFAQQYFNQMIAQDKAMPPLSDNESIIRDEFVKTLSFITYVMAKEEMMKGRRHEIRTHRDEQRRSTVVSFEFEIKDHEISNLRGRGEPSWEVIEEVLRKRKEREDHRLAKAKKEKAIRPKHRKIILK